MVKTKKEKIVKLLLFAYLALFPFGQLLRVSVSVGELSIRIHPTDLVALGIFTIWLYHGFSRPKLTSSMVSLVAVAGFSLLYSIELFGWQRIILGLLYFLRFSAYLSMIVVSWEVVKKSEKNHKLLINSMALVSLFLALFGWIQYFIYPDLTSLTIYGWDDHLYRLVGTYLDPGFTSILIVFGLLLTISIYLHSKKKHFLYLSIILLVTLAFTYSRAGYLSLLTGMVVLYLLNQKLKIFLSIVFGFAVIVIVLPRPAGEGVKLERTNSINQRLVNYSQTFQIIKKSPLLGIGFNNFCVAREKFLRPSETSIHSCSGTDSSILFFLATTGVIGLMMLVRFGIDLIYDTSSGVYGNLLLASLAALFMHSLFANSMFYPWSMGWMAILIGLTRKGGLEAKRER